MFTTVLGVFTVNLARSTRLAAEAADLSGRAAVAIEMPRIRTSVEGFGFGDSWENGVHKHNCVLSYLRLRNLGRTKASVIGIRCGWTLNTELPNVPVYTFEKHFPLGIILDEDIQEMRVDECVFETLDGPFYDRIREGAIGLWFYCSLAYLDFMQEQHEVGFCWKRYQTVGSGGFGEDATPAYNRKT